MTTIYTVDNSDLKEFREKVTLHQVKTSYKEVPNEGLSTTCIYFDELSKRDEKVLDSIVEDINPLSTL